MTRKTAIFDGWSRCKFNNLGLALDINLKYFNIVAKRLKLKVRKLWGLTPTVVEVTGKKLVGWAFPTAPPPPPVAPRILNRVKV